MYKLFTCTSLYRLACIELACTGWHVHGACTGHVRTGLACLYSKLPVRASCKRQEACIARMLLWLLAARMLTVVSCISGRTQPAHEHVPPAPEKRHISCPTRGRTP